MKKIISMILIVCLTLGGQVTFSANGTTTVNTWDELKAAVNAAPTNGTETKIIVGSDLTATSNCYIDSNRNIVIENASGNNYTITRGSEFLLMIFGISGVSSELTLKNITVDGNGGNATAISQIVYMWSGKFTMDGAIIQNVRANVSGGQAAGVNSESGIITMRNGAVINNVVNSQERGGLLATNDTILNMLDSSVTNCSGSFDGGIFIDSAATFNMSGNSTITGNKGENGAIFLYGTFNLSGNPTISGNTKMNGTTACNVFLYDTATINVTAPLINTTPIGITTMTEPSAATPRRITANSSEDWSSYFISDNVNNIIVNSGTGSAQFVQLSVLSTAPTVTNSSVAKAAATQAWVNFTLTNALTGTWKVYDAQTGGSLVNGVTASASGTTLTLAHETDILAGTYYVSLTEAGKAESTRLALTINAEVNTASVATVKALIEGETYTMTQAAATNEAAVKTGIETKIATLALDGVTPVVTKVLYAPAVSGDVGTPAGTNGTYTFTVGLSKGGASATTATMTMNITATAYVTSSIDVSDTSPGTLPTGVTYASNRFTIGIGANNTTITAIGTTNQNGITVANNVTGLTLVLNGITMTGSTPIYLLGNANITVLLADGTSNTLHSAGAGAGIKTSSTATINITGTTGSLTAIGGESAAGIGGTRRTAQQGMIPAYNGNGGNITISGGIVNATGGIGAGGQGAAGIGGGIGGNGGNTTISGGIVTATGGMRIGLPDGGAGIGGGSLMLGVGDSGSGGNITISGGNVTATGGFGASGIGGGSNGGNGGTITIDASATVKAVSDASNRAIHTLSGTLEGGSTAKLLMANFTSQQAANTNTSVYVKSPFSLLQSFTPTKDYNSVAFTVPSNSTYQLMTGGILQQHTLGLSSDFEITGAGLSAFGNVEVDPDSASVATVKGLVECATYTMTQASATDEAAAKTGIEAKIETLALDSVTPVVTKVLYTPAVAGTAVTPTGTNGTYTFTVGLSKGVASATTATLTISITATAYVTPNSDGGSNTPIQIPDSIPDSSGADIIVNGDTVKAGTSVYKVVDGQTVTTIFIDEKKLEQKLSEEGSNSVVTLLVNSDSDVFNGELNGQMVKSMEVSKAIIEIKTDSATYTLPAEQINIVSVSEQLGSSVELKDIKVVLTIAKPSDETVKVVENSAKKGEFIIVAPAVEFTLSCTYEGKTLDVSTFNAYVERTVAIPEGIDSRKITTGVIIDSDGTVRHVPTKIVIIDGKYYAKINSLTNSIYSVIWNPIEFTDVKNHWAKDEINDMGSRMVLSGVGNELFAPESKITRAEFAAILVRGLGLKPGTGNNYFTDIKTTDWYLSFIETAYAHGIISGYDNEHFGPKDQITREQAMTMLARAMKITGLHVELDANEAEKILAVFGDAKQSSVWSKESMAVCVKAGIVSGKSDSMLAPKDNITRAEVAVIVRRLLQKSSLI